MTYNVKPVYLGRIVGNCYIIRTDKGFVLIDTGRASKRRKLERELEKAGCRPGDLDLIILTHGDFDHSGNCSYLRGRFGARIAMHRDDSGMVERGDMFWNRKRGGFIMRKIVNFFFRIERFRPDISLDEGNDLAQYGLKARVLHLPGHSKGSIGILTGGGDLFCGDLLTNTKRPELNSIIDDPAEARTSVRRLRGYNITLVYPCHGRPFPMSSLTEGTGG
ncbi:MAG: MBL fold metallo-hydrolase [Deltaproteobacteria bacterium]|nr:MBL fold metallo-hydrolase [Deltaproteobacteria bacterium]